MIIHHIMHRRLFPFSLLATTALGLATTAFANPLVYKGAEGPGAGKKLVFIASDHEYRAEETLPALARILAKRHGFDCTVLFGLDENGEIKAGESHIPGTDTLSDADGLVMFTRFQDLPDEQMKPIHDYLQRGGPVVGLRTSTHGFKIKAGKTYSMYDFQYKGEEYKGGFGEQVLGQTWVGHYGRNHQQSTRIVALPAKAAHPILIGVKDIHVQCGGYNAEPSTDWDILTMAQPLMSMEFDGEPDATKPPEASEWTREYTGADGQKGRVFTSLYGASEDILNPGYRRLVINGVYWSMGLEGQIKADSDIAFVGDYKPNTFRNGGHARGVKPAMYDGWESQIPANNNTSAPEKKQPKKKDQVTAAAPAAAAGLPFVRDAETTSARYVRVGLRGNKRILTLAEVEVFSNGRNIAPTGKTRQSAVASDGESARAIDGNKNPAYGEGGQTHTPESNNPWWELDLGAEQPVGAVAIWNRGDGDLGSRLDGFHLQLLDKDRKKVFERTAINAPTASVYVKTQGNGKVAYVQADGKPSQELAAAGSVEVPADYRDPAEFAFQKGDVVVSIGNALGERFQHHGDLEIPLQAALPEHQLSLRNMCLSGDMVDKFPRSKGFTPMDSYLQHVGADVILCFFGYNESFQDNPADYTKQLVAYVRKLRSYQPNGETFPRIVLCSPIAHENLKDPNLPNGKDNNRRLAKYTEATRAAAEQAGVTFVDLFSTSKKLYRENAEPLTLNGIHLNQFGGKLVGAALAKKLAGKSAKRSDALVAAVEDKNWQWFNRYRATDGNDVWGSRSGLKFVDDQTNAEVLQHELVMLDVMTANRDKAVWAAAQGKPHSVVDENVPPPVPVISNVGGGSRSSNASKEGSLNYLSGEEGISKMNIPDEFEVNLFADEAMFPEMVNPVQMQVDSKGRLWAAVWPTYPKMEPLKEMRDALVILTDTDNDGVADSCKEFARVHNPLGFEFWNGGVLVTSQPDLIFLKDTDGDDVADVRYVILNGFGSSDTHHTANNLIMGPGGNIYWQSGVFLQHAHEHPWGAPLITGASAMFRWDPRRQTIAVHAGNSPNPHGIAFDGWGYHYANDGTGGRSYQVRPEGSGFKMHTLLNKEFRPVAANAVVSSSQFPDEMQGDFLICNTITYLGVKSYDLHRDGYEVEITEQRKNKDGEKEDVKVTKQYKVGEVWGTPDIELLRSDDGNFRPTDAVFGEDGALYVSDWSNVIIGHMQHNVRDPNRDKKHGRIYRMTYKGRPLQKPVAIDGVSEDQLMANLEHPIDGVRHRTRVEISGRPTDKVIAAAEKWIAKWDKANPDHARHLLEGLWVHQQHNVRNRELLDTVLASPVEHARIAAATVKHHWDVADPALGMQEFEEEEEVTFEAGGLVSDAAELTTFRVNTVVEQMRYDVKELTVKAGKKVKVIFNNPDALPHNLVLVKPGTADAVAMAAIQLGADGFTKKFIPDSKDILAHTDLVDGGETEELEFTAPTEPGNYSFVCTFPGHASLMRGVLKVE